MAGDADDVSASIFAGNCGGVEPIAFAPRVCTFQRTWRAERARVTAIAVVALTASEIRT